MKITLKNFNSSFRLDPDAPIRWSIAKAAYELLDPFVQWSGSFCWNPMINFFNENQLTHRQMLMQHFGVRMEVLVFFPINEQDGKMNFPELRGTIILQAVPVILFGISGIPFFRIVK
ncbi:hypothetical protein D3C78_1377490 [compost metagenome]